MYLKNLIAKLEEQPQDKVCKLGFSSPHSYRGYYDELAFEPARDVTVASMLKCAKESLGSTFRGYKGGKYKMHEYTQCWLANFGQNGETIGPYLLRFILGEEL